MYLVKGRLCSRLHTACAKRFSGVISDIKLRCDPDSMADNPQITFPADVCARARTRFASHKTPCFDLCRFPAALGSCSSDGISYIFHMDSSSPSPLPCYSRDYDYRCRSYECCLSVWFGVLYCMPLVSINGADRPLKWTVVNPGRGGGCLDVVDRWRSCSGRTSASRAS